MLGRVAAGSPIEAIEDNETITVPETLIPSSGRSFVLTVRGSSMIDEQIRDGDQIIVHERNTARNGETVVALVGGTHATVKKFYRERDGRIRLQPANETMDPIIVPAEEVAIQGVVVGVIRKY